MITRLILAMVGFLLLPGILLLGMTHARWRKPKGYQVRHDWDEKVDEAATLLEDLDADLRYTGAGW